MLIWMLMQGCLWLLGNITWHINIECAVTGRDLNAFFSMPVKMALPSRIQIWSYLLYKNTFEGETHRSRPQNSHKKTESLPLSRFTSTKPSFPNSKAIHQSMAAEREMNSCPHSFCSVTAMVRVMFDWISLGRSRLQWFQLSCVCVSTRELLFSAQRKIDCAFWVRN